MNTCLFPPVSYKPPALPVPRPEPVFKRKYIRECICGDAPIINATHVKCFGAVTGDVDDLLTPAMRAELRRRVDELDYAHVELRYKYTLGVLIT